VEVKAGKAKLCPPLPINKKTRNIRVFNYQFKNVCKSQGTVLNFSNSSLEKTPEFKYRK
jgi:hypothetical protein